MSQSNVNGTEQVVTVDSTVEEILSFAGSIWQARLNIGRAVIRAQDAKIKLLDVASKLVLADANSVRDSLKGVVSLKTAAGAKSGLSVLATIARAIGDGFASPDKKHVVTAEQVAAWNLSVSDLVFVARKIKADEVKVSTFTGYIADAEKARATLIAKVATAKSAAKVKLERELNAGDFTGAAAVRAWVASNQKEKPASEKASLKVSKDTLKLFVEKLPEGTSTDDFLKALLAKK